MPMRRTKGRRIAMAPTILRRLIYETTRSRGSLRLMRIPQPTQAMMEFESSTCWAHAQWRSVGCRRDNGVLTSLLIAYRAEPQYVQDPKVRSSASSMSAGCQTGGTTARKRHPRHTGPTASSSGAHRHSPSPRLPSWCCGPAASRVKQDGGPGPPSDFYGPPEGTDSSGDGTRHLLERTRRNIQPAVSGHHRPW